MIDYSKYFLNEVNIEKRMDICRSCEEYKASSQICGKCKCYLPWKVKMAQASCPIGKWKNTIDSVDDDGGLALRQMEEAKKNSS
jgi:ribosomal protein L32